MAALAVCHAVVDALGQRLEITHAGLDRHGRASKPFDQRDGLGEIGRRRHRVRHAFDLPADVDGDDVRALLGQPHRVTAALSARGACQQRYPAVDSAHMVPRLVGRLTIPPRLPHPNRHPSVFGRGEPPSGAEARRSRMRGTDLLSDGTR
jgi:hypothetical protein